ncbi:MAG: hypothetical protein AB7C95_04675 [Synergistaceae bacterium]
MSNKTAWMITVPKDRIGDFKDEVKAAKKEDLVKNFRISPNIKSPKLGDILFVVYDGKIRGYMPIFSNELKDSFSCNTSYRQMPAGRYLVCVLSRYKQMPYVSCKGFQGIRRVDFEKFPELKQLAK